MWKVFAFHASTFSASTQSVQGLGQYVDFKRTGIQFLAKTRQLFLLPNKQTDFEPNQPLLTGCQRHEAAGCEAGRLLPTTVDLKNVWTYTSDTCCIFKHRDKCRVLLDKTFHSKQQKAKKKKKKKNVQNY
jgi:hypothetical protein